MKQRRYLVTGGCGFIGSHLVDALVDRGHQVIVLDDLSTGKREDLSKQAELHIGTICDEGLVRQLMSLVDGCFHLAAIASVTRSTEDWIVTHQVNQTGSIQVFNAARKGRNRQPIPIVFASSSAVYGDSNAHPRVEGAVLCPHSPYGADKLASEYHAHVGYFIYELSIIGLRFFNIYGPRQSFQSDSGAVVPIFLNNILQEQPLTIYGDGKQIRDFVYVEDAVRFLLGSMAHLESHSRFYGIFNVCSGHATSINHLARSAMKILQKNVPVIHVDPRLGDIQFSLGHPQKALDNLELQVHYSLEEGLSQYIRSM